MNALAETCLLHQYFHIQFSLGISLRSSLSTAIYEKALRVDRSKQVNARRGLVLDLLRSSSQIC